MLCFIAGALLLLSRVLNCLVLEISGVKCKGDTGIDMLWKGIFYEGINKGDEVPVPRLPVPVPGMSADLVLGT
jgi:hypothetical protein